MKSGTFKSNNLHRFCSYDTWKIELYMYWTSIDLEWLDRLKILDLDIDIRYNTCRLTLYNVHVIDTNNIKHFLSTVQQGS